MVPLCWCHSHYLVPWYRNNLAFIQTSQRATWSVRSFCLWKLTHTTSYLLIPILYSSLKSFFVVSLDHQILSLWQKWSSIRFRHSSISAWNRSSNLHFPVRKIFEIIEPNFSNSGIKQGWIENSFWGYQILFESVSATSSSKDLWNY